MAGRAVGAAVGLLLLLGASGGRAQEGPAPESRGPRVTSSPYRLMRIHLPAGPAGQRVAASQGSAVVDFGTREAVQLGSVFQVYDRGLFVGLVRVEQVWRDSARVRLVNLDRKLEAEDAYPLAPGHLVVPRLVLLETVRFDSTGLDLPLDMQERLRSTVRFIRAFPEYPVVLEAHAAGGEKKKAAPKARAKARKGGPPPTPGVSLPRRRAEELRTYLHEVQRIPLEQLHVRDLGESRPLANSATAAGRRQNQRIEIVVRDQVEAEVDTSAAPPPASTAPPGRRR